MAADDITLLMAAPAPLTREALRRLPGVGRTMLHAATLAEALEMHTARRPHVVVIDADLPGALPGASPDTSPGTSPDTSPGASPDTSPAAPAIACPALELVRAIRTRCADEDAFLIVLTEADAHEQRAQALALGANDALRLPLEAGELDARVKVGARQARMARRLRDYSDRLGREMARVAELQMRLLPSASPYLPGLHVESLYRPSGDASGDYFDHFILPPRRNAQGSGNGQGGAVLRVIIADVSGHGARAAFLMSIVRTLVRAQADGAICSSGQAPSLSITETVSRINRHLVDIIGGEPDFVTLIAGDIDFAANTLEYVNAGHCPALLRQEAGAVVRLPSNAPLLGFFSASFSSCHVPFPPGSQLLLFTDGLHDWTTASGTRLGPERFLALAESCLKDGNCVLASVEAALHETAGGSPPVFRDDVTALWIRRETT